VSLFEWDESYSIEYPQLDNQHKRWFQLAQKMHLALVTGSGKETLGESLSTFIAFTQQHFAAEERLMLTHGYPDYPHHQHEHESLRQKLAEIQRDFASGNTTVTMDLLQFLKVWLGHHIRSVDIRVGTYLNERARRAAARDAQADVQVPQPKAPVNIPSKPPVVQPPRNVPIIIRRNS
jgi:hemerythrin